MDHDWQRVVDELPGLVWSAAPGGAAEAFGRRWLEYTGLQVDAARGDGWRQAIHHDDRDAAERAWRSAIASAHDSGFEARLRRSDGLYRWFVVRMSATLDASGTVSRWQVLATDVDDQRRREAGLRDCKDQLQLIVDHIPALITFMSPEGDLRFVNRQVVEYFGASADALKAKVIGETIHADDRERAMRAWWHSVATGEPFEVEVRRPRRDGVQRWFRVRGDPLRDAGGDIVVWYLLHTDIDARKRAELLLAGEKRLLETVAGGRPLDDVLDRLCRLVDDTAGDGHCAILVVDPIAATFRLAAGPSLPSAGVECDADRPIDRTVGPAGLAAASRRPVSVADPAADPRFAAGRWRDAMTEHRLGSCWATPILSRTRQLLGTLAWYRHPAGEPDRSELDRLEQLTHIASIAIERSNDDVAQRRNEAFLVRAQELSATGSYWWHVASGEIRWSEQLHRIYGYPTGTRITNDLVRDRFHPDDLPLFHAMIAQAEGAGRDFEYEHRVLLPDGSVRHVQVVAHGAPNADGALEFIGAVQDITERRLADQAIGQARAELARMARVTSLGALTASIAHEVNQPLSGIVTNAGTCLRMLAADPPNIDGARETARRTIRDGNRAAAVVGRLRALFANRDAGVEPIDLNDAAREVVALSQSELQRHGVLVQTRLDDTVPTVIGDRVQLQQVILNLLLNASEAMRAVDDRPRRVCIGTGRDGDDHVRLTVADRGIGLDPRNDARLFEAFYTTKPDGMGIGLSVSRSIIERHRGRLWAVPNDDGPGATFCFSIPLRPPNEAANDERRAVRTDRAADAGRVAAGSS